MDPEERYLFDLQGYLIIRGALPSQMVERLNKVIDYLETLSDTDVDDLGATRRYTEGSIYARAGMAPEGMPDDYTSNILGYGGIFEDLVDWPSTMPYVEEMIGEPCLLDASTLMCRHGGGAMSFHHGCAELLPYSEFVFEDGQFRCVSVKISYSLNDVGIGDGCFAVIPGSHKSNFHNPLVGQIPDPENPLVRPLPTRAGDAIIFSEDLSHGAVENRRSCTRRTLFYSFAPAFHSGWRAMAEPAQGFEERASCRRLELINGPEPFLTDS